jgi:hypothetical protein
MTVVVVAATTQVGVVMHSAKAAARMLLKDARILRGGEVKADALLRAAQERAFMFQTSPRIAPQKHQKTLEVADVWSVAHKPAS